MMLGRRLSRRLSVISGSVLFIWPVLIWFGLRYHCLPWLLPLMLLLLILRLWQARHGVGPMRFVIMGMAWAGVILCLASVLLRQYQLLLYWPVVVNLVMLSVFFISLWTRMPLVERLARLQDPALPPEGVSYTRKVTQVWCVFFVFNGMTALATVLYGDVAIWMLWNGLLSYFAIGILMALEWLFRYRLKKRKI